MERGPFCHVCFQSRWVSRRASGYVGDISSHHHIDSAISFVIGLASMSPVYGSNQQSGTKPTINSTGINDSSIQLVRDVSAQIDRGSCCSFETEVQTELPGGGGSPQQRFCCRRPCLHSAYYLSCTIRNRRTNSDGSHGNSGYAKPNRKRSPL